jgi:hypothetical protein
LEQPAVRTTQPATGFQVASVHSIDVSAIGVFRKLIWSQKVVKLLNLTCSSLVTAILAHGEALQDTALTITVCEAQACAYNDGVEKLVATMSGMLTALLPGQ